MVGVAIEMSRLPRPYIPLEVRLKVAERQAGFKASPNANNAVRLAGLLMMLFGAEPVHLDHDPPLGARKKVYRNGEHVDYTPAANDPDYLIYRIAVDHRIKTLVRGEHGQHPDRVLIKRQRHIETPIRDRPKQKIKSANRWPPKGTRKIQNRSK